MLEIIGDFSKSAYIYIMQRFSQDILILSGVGWGVGGWFFLKWKAHMNVLTHINSLYHFKWKTLMKRATYHFPKQKPVTKLSILLNTLNIVPSFYQWKEDFQDCAPTTKSSKIKGRKNRTLLNITSNIHLVCVLNTSFYLPHSHSK